MPKALLTLLALAVVVACEPAMMPEQDIVDAEEAEEVETLPPQTRLITP